MGSPQCNRGTFRITTKVDMKIQHQYSTVTKLQDKKLKVCVTILHLGRDFVTGNFYSILPVPNVHHHVVLSTDRQYILQVWSKSLHTDISDIHYSRKKSQRDLNKRARTNRCPIPLSTATCTPNTRSDYFQISHIFNC